MRKIEINKTAKRINTVLAEKSNATTDIKEFYVNVDGEDIAVDVKDEKEYSCLLNCLEGYYFYGIG